MPELTCSFERHSAFSGKHSAIQQLMHKDYTYTHKYPPLSICRYLFIHLVWTGAI